MRILTRYIIQELVGPTLIGFGFYTFIILTNQLFRLAEMIIRRSLPIASVLKLLALTLPHIVVLTIPMALLFGILIAIGRLSSDSEIIAMRSVGISTMRIYRPVFYFSFLVFLLNLGVMNYLTPWGNATFEALKSEIFTATIEREIKPRVFYDEYPNRVIYVNDVSPDGLWKGVFISDSTQAGRQQVIVATSGHLVTDDKGLWLELTDAENHLVSGSDANRYDRSRNATQRILLPDQYSGVRAVSYSKSIRSMNLGELFDQRHRLIKEDPDGVDLRLTLVEIHKKFSVPFACLAFGVVALPLGITNRRGGRSSGFTLSIGVILVYYILLSNGEEMARAGRLSPSIAMWIPNAALVLLGAWLIRRANLDNRGAGEGSRAMAFLRNLLRRLHVTIASRRAEARRSVLSRIDIPFPNTLDRYVLREFLKILMAIVLSIVVLQLVVDYAETAGDISERSIGIDTVLSYYRYLGLSSLDVTIPISVLMGTLITFGLLAKNNEVTAAKSIGVSLYRIAFPVILVAILFSGIEYLLLDYVLPYSNEKVASLRAEIKGSSGGPRSFSTAQRQWVFGKGRYLYNFLNYDRTSRTLSRVQVFEFDPVSFKLVRRIYADEARFDGTGWIFVDGWLRTFKPDGSTLFAPINTPVRLHYTERPEYFDAESKLPDQMTYSELRSYISALEASGYSAAELRVDLYHKTAWPFVSLVMALIALPFSFRIGKRGALYGVGVALLVAFVYYAVYSTFTKFGEVGNLPALLSAWSTNILFVIAAVYMFLHAET